MTRELIAASTVFQWIAGIVYGFGFIGSYQGVKFIGPVFKLDTAATIAVLAGISLVCLVTSSLWFRRARGLHNEAVVTADGFMAGRNRAALPDGIDSGTGRGSVLASGKK